MTHLSVSVLGELKVLIDDVPVSSFKSEKVRALLAYLAVEGGRPHRRETLIGLLWPDCPEEAARHNLRQALFNLRLALGDHTARPPYLLISRDDIQLNPESDYSLDLDQFNACFSAWDKNGSQASEAAPTRVSQLEEMVQLYHGEFLHHFLLGDSAEFEEWILAKRESLHQQVMVALTILASEYDRQGDFQTARRYASRQLELDPWREEAHCQTMRLLALEGQRSAALAQYETCRRVLAEELGAEPSAPTRDLYEQIRAGTIQPRAETQARVPSAPIHNLPASLTPFIGREQELAGLGQLIADPECRCITLVGPGGIGKTRLALQAAEQHWKGFTHGAAFIPLASAGSVEAAILAIADAIHFEFYGPKEPELQLLTYLREKQILLVLDNLEHLLVEGRQPGTIAELLVEILRQAGQVKMLVTSREALNLQGEWPFEVRGLSFPEPEQAEEPGEYSALALFVQRARRIRPDFVLTPEDKSGVACLCRLVEGMPLAIELAASWVRLLSPAEILAEIENSLDFLNTQLRDVPERHRSIRAVFDHSWQALTDQEQGVLSRLSVFRGGFGRQAAERVAGASLQVLSSLMVRSLLRRTSTGRYDLHELVRQYAASKLAEDPHEQHTVQERHSLYYLGLLKEKDAKLHSQRQNEALAELTLEMDNLRAAWDGSIAQQNFLPLYQVSTTLWYLFELRNWYKDGEDTFRKTAEALRSSLSSGPEDIRQVTLNAMLAHYGYFQFRLGRGEEAYKILEPSAAYLRARGELPAAIYSIWYLGLVCWQLGRYSEAKNCLQESLALTQACGDRWYEALASEFLGILAREDGSTQPSQQYLQEAVSIFRQLGDPMMISHGLTDLGHTLYTLGEYSQAGELLRESFETARELECRFGMGLALDVLAQVTSARSNYAEARTLFSESASLFREIGDTYRLSQVLEHQGFNSLSLQEYVEAQPAFLEALNLAKEGGLMPVILNALAGLAAIETAQAPGRGTLELVIAILQHPSSNKEAKDLASQLRAELEAKLAPGDIEMAKAQAGSKSLDEIALTLACLKPG